MRYRKGNKMKELEINEERAKYFKIKYVPGMKFRYYQFYDHDIELMDIFDQADEIKSMIQDRKRFTDDLISKHYSYITDYDDIQKTTKIIIEMIKGTYKKPERISKFLSNELDSIYDRVTGIKLIVDDINKYLSKLNTQQDTDYRTIEFHFEKLGYNVDIARKVYWVLLCKKRTKIFRNNRDAIKNIIGKKCLSKEGWEEFFLSIDIYSDNYAEFYNKFYSVWYKDAKCDNVKMSLDDYHVMCKKENKHYVDAFHMSGKSKLKDCKEYIYHMHDQINIDTGKKVTLSCIAILPDDVEEVEEV